MLWPSSQLILEGDKTVEARPYALGHRSIAHPGVEMWLVEMLFQGHAVFNCWLFVDGAWESPMPKKAQIVGTATFSGSVEYGSLCAFRADRKNHRIARVVGTIGTVQAGGTPGVCRRVAALSSQCCSPVGLMLPSAASSALTPRVLQSRPASLGPVVVRVPLQRLQGSAKVQEVVRITRRELTRPVSP